MQGKKIGNGGPTLGWLKAWGATSVKLFYPDAYNSIDTGVINGYSMPANIVTSLKIYEVAPYFTNVDSGGNVPALLTMNANTWKKLPKEIQEIVDEVATDWTWDVYKRNLAQTEKAFKIMKKMGVKVYALPDEERKRWAKALNKSRVAAKDIAACAAHGYPANEVARYYVKTLRDVEGEQFLVAPNLDPLGPK